MIGIDSPAQSPVRTFAPFTLGPLVLGALGQVVAAIALELALRSRLHTGYHAALEMIIYFGSMLSLAALLYFAVQGIGRLVLEQLKAAVLSLFCLLALLGWVVALEFLFSWASNFFFPLGRH